MLKQNYLVLIKKSDVIHLNDLKETIFRTEVKHQHDKSWWRLIIGKTVELGNNFFYILPNLHIMT